MSFFKTWEGLLAIILALTLVLNAMFVPEFLTLQNQINLFQLSNEKIIVALAMTFIIISAEIDLSVASTMGLSACTFAYLVDGGAPASFAIVVCLLVGAVAGAINAFWVAYVGIPSLVVTLASLIGFRGLARVLLEDKGIGNFPDWFNALGRNGIIGPFPLAFVTFVVMLFEVARYSGVKVARVRATLFTMSGVVAALAGLFYAARLASVRGDAANGFELDIITMVLLGGVSIFGGKGSMLGVVLSILIVLNLRNGMALENITGHIQTAVIGILLISSVLIPNLIQSIQSRKPAAQKQ
jgi:rhamnose transport system permease protein